VVVLLFMYYQMNKLKNCLKFLGQLLFACMFAACMVLGVVPIIPKRKEQFEIEIKTEQTEKEMKNTTSFTGSENEE
jgi:hypothetical protein